jgi:hypothetical protein
MHQHAIDPFGSNIPSPSIFVTDPRDVAGQVKVFLWRVICLESLKAEDYDLRE